MASGSVPSQLTPTLRAPRAALRGQPLLLLGLCLFAGTVLLTPPACRSLPEPVRVVPVPPEASAAFEEARAWARATPFVAPSIDAPQAREIEGSAPIGRGLAWELTDPARARSRARSAAERAVDLAPDWVAPRRLLDSLAGEDLLGLESLQAHRAALSERPEDPAQLYLAGRLEGERGRRRFARAVALDPDFAWGHHGLAWAAAAEGELGAAQGHGRMALARARDPYERSFFTAALARYQVAGDQVDAALELLERRLSEPETTSVDRIELAVQAAQIELSLVFRPEYERGWQRALELLRKQDLTERETQQLVKLMRLFQPDEGELELPLALAARNSPMRDRLRAELMLEQRSTPLALGLLRRSGAGRGSGSASGPLLRAARFAAGQPAQGVEEWLLDVPLEARGEAGLPEDPTLSRIVSAARRLGPRPTPGDLAAFGELLLEAGWFPEARSVASVLAQDDLDRALELEDRAAAGLQLLSGLGRLMQTLDERSRAGAGLASASGRDRVAERDLGTGTPASVGGLRGLLVAMSPLVARTQALLGGEIDEERVAEELAASPLVDYGPIGSLVHPGPWFSEQDEEEGLGRAGAAVPGLSALCARLGRFGVFGELRGEGVPDGTLLQRVAVERRSGEHFDVAWSGTVALCEGADLLSRAGRRGALVSGAALHEGYWIDFDALRAERDVWVAFEREYATAQATERLERALAARGLLLESPERNRAARRTERRDIDTLLGQADRVRLAVVRDRLVSGSPGASAARATPDAPPRADAGLVPLDELVAVTELHEQAHLCDRTRFLPITSHLGAALKLLITSGFSATGVAQRLEYRAELSALCTASDPRVVLVAILSAVESGGNGVTPHARAYRALLSDLITTLDRDLEAHPGRWPELDRDHVLVHQLHHLGPEKLRTLALLQASSEGLR